MKRRRRTPHAHPAVSPAEMYALEHGHIPPCGERHEYPGSHIKAFNLCYPSPGPRLARLRATWALVRDDVLRRWVDRGELPWAERTLNNLKHSN